MAYEPLTLALDAEAVAQFNSDDLELGNEAKGLTGATGPAHTGHWWPGELPQQAVDGTRRLCVN